ncbi:MAG: hypothetical protein WB992_01205 [Bryobacteraceae bacterium]
MTSYRNRRAVQIENDLVRVTVTVEGGHVAEILHKPTGVNPLWTPAWPSIEPSSYEPARHPEYGSGSEAQLLAGILGHNICLDTFGAPSLEEAAAGMPVHGEAPVATYNVSASSNEICMSATLSEAELRFERRIRLDPDGVSIRFSEAVENLSKSDRPIAWTQHVTVGPPFLERGSTQFRASATRSKVIDSDFNEGRGMQKSGEEFDWPFCPAKDGSIIDLRVFTAEESSGGFTAHLMNPENEQAWFLAWSPATKVLFGYVWERADFPWLARWEENHLRTEPPWNGQGLTCGMEFGVSPFVESRRRMVSRGSLFGIPTYRWAPARTRLEVNYRAFVTTAESIPEAPLPAGLGSVSA